MEHARMTGPRQITVLTKYEEFALEVGKLFIFALGMNLLFRGVAFVVDKAIGPVAIPTPSVKPQETQGGETCSRC